MAKKTSKLVGGTNQLEDIYTIAADTSVSVIVEGEHGIGKSESVFQFAKPRGFHVEPLFLSNQEVADLIGNPTPITIKGTPITTWSKPIWLHRMEEAAKKGMRTILFLDELNRAQTEVRQAALQLVLDKRIHEHKLPSTTVDGVEYPCFVIAAINPTDSFYQVDEIDPALMDRFLHYELKVNADNWLEWAPKNNVLNHIIAFIAHNKEKLQIIDENATVSPTPRSWVKLSELLRSYEDKEYDNHALLNTLVAGKIGAVVGAQFVTYYKEHSVFVSVDEIDALSKKQYKRALKKYAAKSVESMDYVAAQIQELIEPLEVPLLKELSDNMVNKYLDSEKNTTFETAYPLLAYMHALPIEQLTSIMKALQIQNEDTGCKMYDNIAAISPGKQIFHRIISKVKKLTIT